MMSRITLFALFVALTAVQFGCKSGDQAAAITTGSSATLPATIVTALQAEQAASQVLQTEELFYTSINLLKATASKAIDVMVNDPTLASTAVVACGDYGDYKYTGSVNSAGTYSLTLTFELCREDGFQFDGELAVSGTQTNLNAIMGSSSKNFRIVDFSDTAYSAITGSIATTLQFSMTGTRTSTQENYDISPSGSISAFDYVMLGDFRIIFDSAPAKYSMSIDPTTHNRTTNVTMNGDIAESWGSGYMRLSLTGFTISKVETFLSNGPPVRYSASDTTVSGSASYLFSPTTYGLGGVITTSTSAPIHQNYATGYANSGQLTVSGTGSAVVQFSATGDVSVTVSAGTPVNFSSPGDYYLEKLVNFYGFEQTPPKYMGIIGSVSATAASGSTWPSTMTVTALSSGPDLACYTDVHVNYYSPADYPTKTITWYVDYHVSGCTSPSSIPFKQATDVNGDGICDAGLDINAAATDNTSGALEHFTATDLPTGYYIISINNWSCATTVTNTASLVVGDYLFGTYSCSYTASDGDGTDPGAWCRIADLRRNADGSADVLTPDATMNPWHN